MKCETKLSPKQQALAFLEAGRAIRPSPRLAESPSSPESAPSPHIGPALANAADSPRSEDPEARRIAAELVKLHRDGAISGPNDPEAPLGGRRGMTQATQDVINRQVPGL